MHSHTESLKKGGAPIRDRILFPKLRELLTNVQAFDWAFLGVALILLIPMIWGGIDAYRFFNFTSDGFHYFSVLRNFVDGLGDWEGPVFEHILGNHSYFSLFLLAPAVALVRDPVVMVLAAIACWFISGIIFYLTVRELLVSAPTPSRKAAGWLAAAGAAAYLLYPTHLNAAYGYYMFQPDCLLPVALSWLMWSMAKGSKWEVWGASALMLATKEEYIPLFPVIYAFGLVILGSRRLTWRHHAVSSLLFVCISALSVCLLLHFRGINVVDHAARTISLTAFQGLSLTHPVFALMGQLILPLAPGLGLVLFLGDWRARVLLLGAVMVFLVGRLIGDLAIYGTSMGVSWGSAVIAIPVFTALLTALGVVIRRRPGSQIVAAVALLLALPIGGVVASVVNTNGEHPLHAWRNNLAGTHKLPAREREQLLGIAKVLPPPVHAGEYVMVPEYCQYPFMNRSHFSYEWWKAQDANRQKALLLDRRLGALILRPADLKADDAALIRRNFVIVAETDDFLAFVREHKGARLLTD